MESSASNKYQRKSSCATIVPPEHSRYETRKPSLVPLRINTAGTKNLFFDAGSINEISPTTIVSISSSEGENIIQQQQQQQQQLERPEQQCREKATEARTSFFKKVTQKLKRGFHASSTTSTNTTEKNLDYYKKKHALEKQQQHRPVRHSYSDPRLSPGSTAVGDDEEEHHGGYFGIALSQKKSKRTPRGWIAAVLMIVFGILIAITFVLIGLGKALGGNSHIATAQLNSNTTPVASSQTVSVSFSTNFNYSASSFPSIMQLESTAKNAIYNASPIPTGSITMLKAATFTHEALQQTST